MEKLDLVFKKLLSTMNYSVAGWAIAEAQIKSPSGNPGRAVKDTMTKNTAKKNEPKIKTLTPAAARREIAALERMLDDQDIDLQVFWRLKQTILDNLEAL